MNHVDLKYCGILSTRLDQYTVKQNNPYEANFRCYVCGDSQKSKTKKRGWILDKGGKAFYYCHNCGYSKPVDYFLKQHFPPLYNEYVTDIVMEKNSLRAMEPKKEDIKPLDKLRMSQPKFTKATSPLRKIKKVSALSSDHPVKKYVEKRKIPTKQHYRLYYAPKFNKWVNTMLPKKLNEKYDEPRLVIPFIDEKGEMFGFAGRSFDPKASLRYITIMLDDTKSKVFGLDTVNFNKKYYVVEGQIDSLFLTNAVAMAGADGNIEALKNVDNAVFMFDLEPRNPEIVNRMQKVIDRGHSIVILSEKLKALGKDINEMVLNGMSTADIELLLDQHTYKDLEAKLALTIWKRV